MVLIFYKSAATSNMKLLLPRKVSKIMQIELVRFSMKMELEIIGMKQEIYFLTLES